MQVTTVLEPTASAAVHTAPAGPTPGTDDVLDLLAPYTGRQRAAILVVELGPDESAQVLGMLSEQEIEDVSAEVARLGPVPRDVAHAVLRLFGRSTTAAAERSGGYDTARELLISAVGVERAEQILTRVAASIVEMPFHALHTLDPRQIVSVLADEHPQIVAIVLAHLPAILAAQVLASLPPGLQTHVAHRIAVMDRTSPELIRSVELGLERRLSTFGVSSTLSTVGGVRPLVDIINRADRGTERLILEGLEERDPDLAVEVRNEMFTFEDLASLDDRAIQLLLRQVPVNELAPALKGVKESVRTKLLSNLSERAAVDLADELEVLGPVRISVVEEAQDRIIALVRDLESSGQIVIMRGDKDQLVA